jgi:hypothetical protein
LKGRISIGIGVLVVMLAGPASATAVTPAEIVSVLNAEREANGLPTLTEDPALSGGCAAHNNYSMLNGSTETTYFFREEDPSLPGYTPEGAQAGRNGSFFVGSADFASFEYGNPHDIAPGHLFNQMDPTLRITGADQLDFEHERYGTLHLSCIDVRSADRQPRPKRKVHAYAFTGPDGTAPASAVYLEGPGEGTRTGPWVFMYFPMPKGVELTLRDLRARTDTGERIEIVEAISTGGLQLGGSKHTRSPRANATGGFGLRYPGVAVQLGELPIVGGMGVLNGLPILGGTSSSGLGGLPIVGGIQGHGSVSGGLPIVGGGARSRREQGSRRLSRLRVAFPVGPSY